MEEIVRKELNLDFINHLIIITHDSCVNLKIFWIFRFFCLIGRKKLVLICSLYSISTYSVMSNSCVLFYRVFQISQNKNNNKIHCNSIF